MKSFLKTLALLLIIPICGYALGHWILLDISQNISTTEQQINVTQLCASADTLSAEGQSFCNELMPIFIMQKAAIVAVVLSIVLLVLFFLVSLSVGKSRVKIAKVFPPLVFVSLISLSGIALIQGAILTYGVYIGEIQFAGSYHPVIVFGLGLACLMATGSLLKSSLKMMKKNEFPILGSLLCKEKNSSLYKYVEEIAEKLGAKAPGNIVVGLEPNFYVTSSDVTAQGTGEKLTGETLYLSLPLSRIFTKEELRAVIGHELGHFRGDDTVYSLKFAPVYSGLNHAVNTMGNEDGSFDLVSMPANALISYMIDVFDRNVNTIGREREFAADRAAMEVAAPQALATSLLKVSLYANAWNSLMNQVVDRMSRGTISKNLSLLFANTVKYDVDTELVPEMVKELAQESMSHPTDTHPTTASRAEAANIDINSLDINLLLHSEDSAIELFEMSLELEESLTVLQQQYYVAMGVKLPEEENVNWGARCIAAMGAHMVLADGKVEPEEIDEAEKIAVSMTEDFDRIDFREYCNYPATLPTMKELLEYSGGFDNELKKLIFNYLKAIAQSDNEVDPKERELLKQVQQSFQASAKKAHDKA